MSPIQVKHFGGADEIYSLFRERAHVDCLRPVVSQSPEVPASEVKLLLFLLFLQCEKFSYLI